MFNPNVKSQYIQTLIKSSKSTNPTKLEGDFINFFNRLEEQVEMELNKDFAMLNFSEMETALSVFCKRTITYQTSIISKLRQYLDWCIENGYSLDKENRLDGVKAKDIDTTLSIKMTMLRNEEHLIEYLDIVLRPIEDNTIDNMYRICYLLIFSGFTFKEALELKLNNISNNTIIFNNKTILISDYLSKLINDLTELSYYTSFGKNDEERKLPVDRSGYVLERTTSRDLFITSAIPQISLHFKKLKKHLGNSIAITLSEIQMSGIFTRTLNKEVETGIIEFEYMVDDDEVLNLQDLLTTYQSWKKAFNLSE